MSAAFVVQADPSTGAQWTDLAARLETMGYDGLCPSDHPGHTASPFVALAAAAPVTTRLTLGTAVINAGAWHPFALAAEVATLDVLSDGRALLGIGAGHTPSEWTMLGRPYPTATARVANLDAVLEAVHGLLAGDVVTMRTNAWTLDRAELRDPRPHQERIPVLVGGNGKATLRCGARRADIIELTGLGRTLADGHLHIPEWSPNAVNERVDIVTSFVPSDRRQPVLSALVQHVELTDDRLDVTRAFHDRLAALLPPDAAPTLDDLLETPYLLIGTETEILHQLKQHRDRWGITRYTVRTDAVKTLAPIVAATKPS